MAKTILTLNQELVESPTEGIVATYEALQIQKEQAAQIAVGKAKTAFLDSEDYQTAFKSFAKSYVDEAIKPFEIEEKAYKKYIKVEELKEEITEEIL